MTTQLYRNNAIREIFHERINWKIISYIEYLLTEYEDSGMYKNIIVNVRGDKRNSNNYIRLWASYEDNVENQYIDLSPDEFNHLQGFSEFKLSYWVYLRSQISEGSVVTKSEFEIISNRIIDKIRGQAIKIQPIVTLQSEINCRHLQYTNDMKSLRFEFSFDY